MNCALSSRTHAHKLGSVITGYKVHNGDFKVNFIEIRVNYTCETEVSN